ncbi:hypothetical protein VSO52_06940 [Pseudomonas fulva]|uniref:hypothetical protein n=1 Tax=Pseudomonas fulva TaxID=47880 RepID=UPI002DBC7B72|nr:hypothetical protein [Pseudomonas fulva]MEC4022520.1 hypothetical protein [Pseudomonas fulva]
MNIDWNWFFSTLSQSTAAIVGIFGAFLIAKIFSNQSVFSEKTNKIKTLSIEAEKLLDKIESIDFEWYIKTKNEPAFKAAANAIHKIQDGDPTYFSDEVIADIYDECHFSIFSDREDIISMLKSEATAHCEHVRELNIKVEQHKKARQALEDGSSGSIGGISSIMQNMFPPRYSRDSLLRFSDHTVTPWPLLTKERDLITECHLESKHHARVISDFLESVRGNPESPPQITLSLAFTALLFLLGVIYPLTFMPSTTPPIHASSLAELFNAFLSIKGLLLTSLTTAFIFIVGIFIRTNHNMKYNSEDIKALGRLSNANNYCRYFERLAKDD